MWCWHRLVSGTQKGGEKTFNRSCTGIRKLQLEAESANEYFVVENKIVW